MTQNLQDAGEALDAGYVFKRVPVKGTILIVETIPGPASRDVTEGVRVPRASDGPQSFISK